jgi:hypothetical protein
MTRGDTDTVAAAVTLNQSLPLEWILNRTGIVAARGLLASCEQSARLVSSSHQFEVDPSRWVGRSLLSTDTARWSWYLTPKIGGTHDLILDVRPIMSVTPIGDVLATDVSATRSNVLEYDASVHVRVGEYERQWIIR